MEKNVFSKEPLLGATVVRSLGFSNLKKLNSLFLEVEHYFIDKFYGDFGSVPHDHSPICSLVIFPTLQNNAIRLMLGIENGHLALKDHKDGYIRGKSNDELSKVFFKGFLAEGISISFDTTISFFDQSNREQKSLLRKDRKSFSVSCILRYTAGDQSIIHDLSVTEHVWKLTKTEKII